MSHLAYHFKISISPSIDPWNDRDIQIDVCTTDSITLLSIHQIILKTLNLQNSNKLFYKNNLNTLLDMNKTLKELGIDANCTIYLERNTSKRNRDSFNNENKIISLYVTTRIGLKDGASSRKIKIICRVNDDFGDIMDELSDTLERNGLKFRYGRTYLKAGKTVSEQGLYDGSEIHVLTNRGGGSL